MWGSVLGCGGGEGRCGRGIGSVEGGKGDVGCEEIWREVWESVWSDYKGCGKCVGVWGEMEGEVWGGVGKGKGKCGERCGVWTSVGKGVLGFSIPPLSLLISLFTSP